MDRRRASGQTRPVTMSAGGNPEKSAASIGDTSGRCTAPVHRSPPRNNTTPSFGNSRLHSASKIRKTPCAADANPPASRSTPVVLFDFRFSLLRSLCVIAATRFAPALFPMGRSCSRLRQTAARFPISTKASRSCHRPPRKSMLRRDAVIHRKHHRLVVPGILPERILESGYQRRNETASMILMMTGRLSLCSGLNTRTGILSRSLWSVVHLLSDRATRGSAGISIARSASRVTAPSLGPDNRWSLKSGYLGIQCPGTAFLAVAADGSRAVRIRGRIYDSYS